MMRPDPILAYQSAPLGDLLAILLRQYRRPLATHGVHLTDAQAEALAHDIAARAPVEATALRAALTALVEESVQVLARWNLTFAQSLDAEMIDIPGWESTAEFLDIANEKANAELRISTGAALLTALGDIRHAPVLLALVERGEHDLDAVIARRVLLFVSAIDGDDPAWLDKLRVWVNPN
jgi:hypothetical protein